MSEIIDLRSDTVTKPTPEMRRAMADAPVGDAVIDIDPTVQRLEELTAELLGKEAAVYMPSGSMTNQVALRTHCPSGSEFICEADCHVFHYEQAAFASLSGLVPRLIATDGGTIRREQLDACVLHDDEHHARTRLFCIENTHNRWGGRILDQSSVISACQWARSHQLKTHLDGARIWNAAAATGMDLAELAQPFDSVSVCFSKGLGAPVGSALAGSVEFVREARRGRKLFGGAMRQAGIIAAGALYALENHRERLVEDHAAAQRLGDAIAECQGFRIRGGGVQTNMLIFEIDPDRGGAGDFVAKLRENGIWCFAIGPQAVRMVTHLDVSVSQIEQACRIMQRVAADF
ncbi:threonine aldolase family protein [Stieleria varia]|uniref:L-allo-threonine aldolase n=1 Tax=Stieleria varia TaxID=2528005 RepID=A0A5C6AMC5_9BACT|nr:GntG family PLP-dependent aldolase [Stieleria varia]TWU00810.1 L-allo-threonine aldolase [Stieleria varia]